MSGKRLSKEQREAIIRDLRAGKKSMRSISVDHSVSISTVSKIAAELGLSSPRKRSKPVQPPDYSYDKSRRIAVLDMMLKGIEDQIRAGGLNSKQLFDLARSARELTTSRRGEDQLPDALDVDSSTRGPGAPSYESLASVDEKSGVPKNIGVSFGLLDIGLARLDGDVEAERFALERVKRACREAGLSGDIPPDTLEKMIEIAAEKEYQGEGLG